MALKDNLTTQLFRFFLGVAFLTIVNLALLSVTASRTVQDFFVSRFDLNLSLLVVVEILIVFGIGGTWFFGLIQDKVFHYEEAMSDVRNKRNPMFMKILKNTEDIKIMLFQRDKK